MSRVWPTSRKSRIVHFRLALDSLGSDSDLSLSLGSQETSNTHGDSSRDEFKTGCSEGGKASGESERDGETVGETDDAGNGSGVRLWTWIWKV
jgi:hypothetical protein